MTSVSVTAITDCNWGCDGWGSNNWCSNGYWTGYIHILLLISFQITHFVVIQFFDNHYIP
jgi:hypothetical protein